jgi:hypothetical protein
MNRPRHGSSDAGSSKDAGTSKEKSLNVEELNKQIKSLKYKLDRHSIKISKVAELYVCLKNIFPKGTLLPRNETYFLRS